MFLRNVKVSAGAASHHAIIHNFPALDQTIHTVECGKELFPWDVKPEARIYFKIAVGQIPFPIPPLTSASNSLLLPVHK